MSKKGYWLAMIDVADADAYKPYVAAVGGVLAKYKGRFLVRGGDAKQVEGHLRSRIVVIEFPDYATAVECYFSPEYAAAKAIRMSASSADVAVVEGFDGPQPG